MQFVILNWTPCKKGGLHPLLYNSLFTHRYQLKKSFLGLFNYGSVDVYVGANSDGDMILALGSGKESAVVFYHEKTSLYKRGHQYAVDKKDKFNVVAKGYDPKVLVDADRQKIDEKSKKAFNVTLPFYVRHIFGCVEVSAHDRLEDIVCERKGTDEFGPNAFDVYVLNRVDSTGAPLCDSEREREFSS